ncbi:MAG: AmmeMemoRadiSam system radical SAM enzyme [bacterium]|nr:AmmeMemoRadiSam system radical SAM enzyme [bacterium]
MGERIDRRDFARRVGAGVLASAGGGLLPCLSFATPTTGGPRMGLVSRRRAAYFSRLENGLVRCDLCPHRCRIEAGRRGLCGVRESVDGSLETVAYANPCALNIDPIEKKPFYHVLPGTKTLSVATAGCNLRCKSCLNWEASLARPEETFNYELPPAETVTRAEAYRCRSIASSYVEPVVFIEYMLDVARLCRDRRLLHLMHSAGYINRAPLEDICQVIDAACIDLKGFSDEFYRDLVGGELRPVLEALTTLKEHDVHTEVVNLLIPGKNDDPHTLRAMCRWVRQELGAEVPVHFYRFYPRYRLKSLPPTPVPTLERARAIAMEEELDYAYIANVPEHPGKHTYCPGCGELLIRRVGLITEVVALADGRCTKCEHAIKGIWRPT